MAGCVSMLAPVRRRQIRLSRHVALPIDAVAARLRSDPASLVADHHPSADEHVTVRLRAGSSLPLAREVEVHLGPVLDEDDGSVSLPLWWEATQHAPLFPCLDGGLEASPSPGGTELTLVASYRPPLGRPGAVADGILGHRLALACLGDFLDATVARVTALLGGPVGVGHPAPDGLAGAPGLPA